MAPVMLFDKIISFTVRPCVFLSNSFLSKYSKKCILSQFLTISHNYEGNFCNFITKTNFNKTKVLKKYQFSSWKTSKLHMQLIKLSVYLFAILYYLLKFLGILTEVIINSSSSPCLSLF